MPQNERPEGLDALAAIILNVDDRPDDPPSREVLTARRRRRFRRRLFALITTVVVLAVVATYVSLTLSAPVSAAEPTAHGPSVTSPAVATITLPQFGESAVSVSGADDYLGTAGDGILASGGGTSPMPMASISKLITALVILNAKPLGASGVGPTITFDQADAALYDKYYVLGATIAAMPAGSSMTEHDALETMLVVSACNYAEALADWAFGSNAAFIRAAKSWMTAHGLNSTTMVEPTGINSSNTSTPSDLIAVGKLAMADPTLASIVSKTSLDLPGLEGMPNTNDLLGTDGIDGIKTGTLDPGGSDLLFSAQVPVGTPTPLTVIGAVLDGGSHSTVDSAVEAIIASIKAGFHTVNLGEKGQVVGSYATPWGAHATMVLAQSASTLTWSNAAVTSTITTEPLTSGARGERVGTVTWVAGKNTVHVPVLLDGRIAGPSGWWRLTHPQLLLHR